MPITEPPSADKAAETAITRVLSAERNACDAIAHATREAAALNELTRARARALVERTERRIRAVRAAFAARVTAEVATIDTQAVAQDAQQPLAAADLERHDRAVAAFAAELTESAAR